VTERLGKLVDSDKKAPLLELISQADLRKCALHSGYVDPDGLASQAAMAAIIEKFGGTSVSFFKGTFNRPQNKIFRQVLGLNLKSDEELKQEDNYSCVIAVDCPASLCPIQPDFIIDHHESSNGAKIGSDIRLIGATSSIMWEYAMEAGVNFDDENGQKLATALAIGIQTDTKNCTTEVTSKIDYDAFIFCLAKKSVKLYKEIINYSKPMYRHDLFMTGWNNKTVENAVLVTGIGSIPEARSGVISDLADEFVGTEGIHTAVVFAIVDGSIDISVRSKNSALNVDEYVRNAFGSGGGKPGAGRVRIPMTLFQNIPDDLSSTLFECCFKIVKHKALQIAGDKK